MQCSLELHHLVSRLIIPGELRRRELPTERDGPHSAAIIDMVNDPEFGIRDTVAAIPPNANGSSRLQPTGCGPTGSAPRRAAATAVLTQIRTHVDARAGASPFARRGHRDSFCGTRAPRGKTALTVNGCQIRAMRVVVPGWHMQRRVRGLRTDAQTRARLPRHHWSWRG
jgi:hypothetical protein